MLADFLSELFSLDPDFVGLRTEGVAQEVREAVQAFCQAPGLPQPLRDTLLPLAGEFGGIVEALEALLKAERPPGRYEDWCALVEESGPLARLEPRAATLIAAAACAVWEGAMGEHLFFQPWEGHHPGWHVFPLAVAREAIRAGGLWAPSRLLQTASEFIAAAKMAPFDDGLRGVVARYRALAERIAATYSQRVAELAWDLRAASGTASAPSFRPEVAALLWTLGYVPQALLLRANDGVPEYRPSLELMKLVVDHSLRTMADNWAMQGIWLAMKDRPPFDLRAHRQLFTVINARYEAGRVGLLYAMVPPPMHELARLAIGYFREEECSRDDEELSNLAGYAEAVLPLDPRSAFRVRCVLNLVGPPGEQREQNWNHLARFAAGILRFFNENGEFQNVARGLEMPFYYLADSTPAESEAKQLRLEGFRCGALWYWLLVTRPEAPADRPGTQELLDEEQQLLTELRGARFIRLLRDLPLSYRRHGFDFAATSIPEGARPDNSAEGYNPFDQELARSELQDAHARLEGLFDRMRAVIPEYAAVRKQPEVRVTELASLLQSHRSGDG